MNAVEIEEAVSALADAPFDSAEFPYAFLAAFGNKDTTIKRLRAAGRGSTNQSDLPAPLHGVLQRNNIHLAVCPPTPPGRVGETLKALVASPATAKHKAKFALATDGHTIEAENLHNGGGGETLACDYADLGDHFGFFLELAGITVVRAIRENAFDIKATGRLNRLYVELLRHNPGWDAAARREDLNHFFARLIFCFFAEDTGIFHGQNRFTDTLQQMTDPNAANTHEVLSEIFRAMDTPVADRAAADLRPWANAFPYVNGGLFGTTTRHDREGVRSPQATSGADRPMVDQPMSGADGEPTSASPTALPHGRASLRDVTHDVPRFSKIARSYLLHVGSLDWRKVNPDIFGSMIQAVADDAERGALGMHYTSVPNILKVLNPLFLDDLRAKLDEAGDGSDPGSRRKLLNLRRRLARIRVFDPACGSGNFLVIAYKQMRQIEAEVNRRRGGGEGGEGGRRSDIPLTNFRGIELRHFAAEVARLALIIAEYQCDVLHRGQRLALAEFLPLDNENWITHDNALQIDWLKVCPPEDRKPQIVSEHLFHKTEHQETIVFENDGGETYICGNPPYKGSQAQTPDQKKDLKDIFNGVQKRWASLDYIAGWFFKAAEYLCATNGAAGFVSTNSIAQGEQVPLLWPLIAAQDLCIHFCHTSFTWRNLASRNAGVTVAVIGLSRRFNGKKQIHENDESGGAVVRFVDNINAYLAGGDDVIVRAISGKVPDKALMLKGNMPTDGGNLCLTPIERREMLEDEPVAASFLMRYVGSKELIRGEERYCIWVEDGAAEDAGKIEPLNRRFQRVAEMRRASGTNSTREYADFPHRFRQIQDVGRRSTISIPSVSSEARPYLPVGLLSERTIVSNAAFALYDAPLWNLALIASRLHLVWVATVCGKLKTDYRYSNTLGWNTFPVPPLSDQNKADLTRRAEDLLLAREHHWPATIADLYAPARMDTEFPDVREAHDRNDETLERIYVGRRFKNDTERLEHLFGRYTEMTAGETGGRGVKGTGRRET